MSKLASNTSALSRRTPESNHDRTGAVSGTVTRRTPESNHDNSVTAAAAGASAASAVEIWRRRPESNHERAGINDRLQVVAVVALGMLTSLGNPARTGPVPQRASRWRRGRARQHPCRPAHKDALGLDTKALSACAQRRACASRLRAWRSSRPRRACH